MGCWAHVRRKFIEVIKAAGKVWSVKKTGVAEEAVARIGRLYALERSMRERKLAPDIVCQERQQKARCWMSFTFGLNSWHCKHRPRVCSARRSLILLINGKGLCGIYEDARLRPDNNLAENAIRPFVVGRKNWLFSGNPEGAKASAALYSLIETAKANGLEPYWYLRYLFERLSPAPKKSIGRCCHSTSTRH